jgi:hypothetical protein
MFAAASMLLAGCAARPTLYSWGNYEDVIYASYSSKNDFPAEKQIAIMEQDYQVARSQNKRMPPGWHAQLGYLYYEIGKTDQAEQELMTEKAEFPESTAFVDRLLQNLNKVGRAGSP